VLSRSLCTAVGAPHSGGLKLGQLPTWPAAKRKRQSQMANGKRQSAKPCNHRRGGAKGRQWPTPWNVQDLARCINATSARQYIVALCLLVHLAFLFCTCPCTTNKRSVHAQFGAQPPPCPTSCERVELSFDSQSTTVSTRTTVVSIEVHVRILWCLQVSGHAHNMAPYIATMYSHTAKHMQRRIEANWP
jgi:hypothetical protein